MGQNCACGAIQIRPFCHLFQFDHDEDNHGEDVEDDQEARTDSNRQIVPVGVVVMIDGSGGGWWWWWSTG